MAHYNFHAKTNSTKSYSDGEYHFITLSEFDMMEPFDTIGINSANDALAIVLHEFDTIPAFSPIITALYDKLVIWNKIFHARGYGREKDFKRAIKRLRKAFPELD